MKMYEKLSIAIYSVIIGLLVGLGMGYYCFSSPSSDGAGFKGRPAPSIQAKKVNMRVTAYCPCEKCCGKWADGITASGHRITQGDKFAAAPPGIGMPFGTTLLIPGYSEHPVKVLDRGSAITGNRIDVFFPTHQEALNWGVQEIEVTIYE